MNRDPDLVISDLNNDKLYLYRKSDKIDGVHHGPYDGFYSDRSDEVKESELDKHIKYFIKSPANEKAYIESFTEYFAGQFYNQLWKEGLIKDTYKKCFVAARYGKVIKNDEEDEAGNPEYVLIQHYVKEKRDLFKIFAMPQELINLNEIFKNYRKKRNPFIEYFFSGNQCRALARYFTTRSGIGASDSLNLLLMLSIVLGDYSVHSANIFYSKETTNFFGRWDFGAALRYFAHPGNHKNILIAQEYRGLLSWYKLFTKNYLRHYITYIPYCLAEIKQKAKEFKETLDNNSGKDTLIQIITKIINTIPPDMFTKEQKEKIANYINIPEFSQLFSDEMDINIDMQNDPVDRFSSMLADVIYLRIEKLANIKVPSFLSRTLHPKYHPEPWILYAVFLGISTYLFFAHVGIIVLSLLTLTLLSITAGAISSLFLLCVSLRFSQGLALFSKHPFYFRLLVFSFVIASLGFATYGFIVPTYATYFPDSIAHHKRLLLLMSCAFILFLLLEKSMVVFEYMGCRHQHLCTNLVYILSVGALLGLSEYLLYYKSSHALSVSSWAFAGYFFLAAALAIISNRCFIFPLSDDSLIYFLYQSKGDPFLSATMTSGISNDEIENMSANINHKNDLTSSLLQYS
jgi:hypothetical protein